MEGSSDVFERIETLTPTSWEGNAAACLKVLENSSINQVIPFVNYAPLHNLSDCQLVRFRGMVQDMYDPEIFLAKYEIKNTTNGKRSVKSGRFRDTNLCEINEEFIEHSPHNVSSERQTLYCISVPATNSWVTHLEQTQCSVSSSVSKPPIAPSNDKRHIEETDDVTAATSASTSTSSPGSEAKKLCSNSTSEKTTSQRKPFNLNLPLPDPNGKACIVKVYESEEDMQLCLNDVLEVIGFLSLDPQLSNVSDDPLDLELMSDHHPPPSLVPRLHAVSVKKLAHCNPLVAHHTSSDEILADAKATREDLHLLLTQLLLGDELAADFLICHLLSTVYLRRDVISLGQLSLNILNVPTEGDYIKDLYGFLELLLTNSHFLPMTLNNLNSAPFIPRKDYDKNRLSSGILQLSANTHLVLDETALQPGQLNTTGVHNMTALKNVITQQRVNYDFQYYQLEYETNLPVLVFSEGKSLLPCDVSVILEPDATCLATRTEIFQAARHYLKDALLARIRAYLTAMKHATFTMPDDIQEAIQSDFVEMRKNEPSTSPSDLHNLIVLARLVALSRGITTLTHGCWEHAKEMIRRQKQRRVNKNLSELSMGGNE